MLTGGGFHFHPYSTSIPFFAKFAIDLNEARWSSEMARLKALVLVAFQWAIFEIHRKLSDFVVE